jgi:hypothetical protein
MLKYTFLTAKERVFGFNSVLLFINNNSPTMLTTGPFTLFAVYIIHMLFTKQHKAMMLTKNNVSAKKISSENLMLDNGIKLFFQVP